MSLAVEGLSGLSWACLNQKQGLLKYEQAYVHVGSWCSVLLHLSRVTQEARAALRPLDALFPQRSASVVHAGVL